MPMNIYRDFDFDMGFLQDAVKLVDGHLEELTAKADLSPDPDSFGVYDEIEYITGFGFVACQTYITATYGRHKIKKCDALKSGPTHPVAGCPVVALVNECANYWKHSGEWTDDKPPKQAKRTVRVIQSLGVDTKEFIPDYERPVRDPEAPSAQVHDSRGVVDSLEERAISQRNRITCQCTTGGTSLRSGLRSMNSNRRRRGWLLKRRSKTKTRKIREQLQT